jgi:hypothetical protein
MATLSDVVGTFRIVVPDTVDKIEALYDAYSPTVRGPDLSRAEVVAFLTEFADRCEAEGKTDQNLKDERVNAIRQLVDFVDNGGPCGAFPNTSRQRFAAELALRIRRPSVINQKDTVLCGPVSFLQAYFKTEPMAAKNFAIELAAAGTALLKGRQVTANDRVLGGDPTTFRMADVDWILGASLRYHHDLLGDILNEERFHQLTKPGLMIHWLRRMGYHDIRDRTFGGENFPLKTRVINKLSRFHMHSRDRFQYQTEETNLRRAQHYLDQGHLVWIWAYGEMGTQSTVYDKGQQDYTQVGIPNNFQRNENGFPRLHWQYVRKLTVANNRVLIKFYTWGVVKSADFPLDQFLTAYRGHISARV